MSIENNQHTAEKMKIEEVVPQLVTLEEEIRERLVRAVKLMDKSELALALPLDQYNAVVNVSSNPGLDALAKICRQYSKKEN